jgi:hypothetical protein
MTPIPSVATYMLAETLILLVIFQLKHLVADYIFQTKYMLGKFKDTSWVLPLSAHALVHGSITFAIIASYIGIFNGVLIGLIDFIIHFVIDRLKVIASRKVTIDKPKFWIALGVDQMCHHLTHYSFIFIVICNKYNHFLVK